jgi:hypothetical protein
MGVMGSRPTQTKQISQTQSAFTIHAKINLKIICNTTGKNPFGQTCRDHAASDYRRLNFSALTGGWWYFEAERAGGKC